MFGASQDMRRTILLTLGWLAAALGLYAALLGLELCWNLYNWQPRLDTDSMGLIGGALSFLVAIRFLAGATRDGVSQGVAWLTCLALLALAVYVLPPEPLTTGLFARTVASPLWYRAGRFLLLVLPSMFLGRGLWHRVKPFDTGSGKLKTTP